MKQAIFKLHCFVRCPQTGEPFAQCHVQRMFQQSSPSERTQLHNCVSFIPITLKTMWHQQDDTKEKAEKLRK